MSFYNVPDDWGAYYALCDACGQRFHLSEGECNCQAQRKEAHEETMVEALKHATVHVAQMGRPETIPWGGQDDLLAEYACGDRLIVVTVTYDDGTCDELRFTKASWVRLAKEIPGLKKVPINP